MNPAAIVSTLRATSAAQAKNASSERLRVGAEDGGGCATVAGGSSGSTSESTLLFKIAEMALLPKCL
jgi:hypothetical protein